MTLSPDFERGFHLATLLHGTVSPSVAPALGPTPTGRAFVKEATQCFRPSITQTALAALPERARGLLGYGNSIPRSGYTVPEGLTEFLRRHVEALSSERLVRTHRELERARTLASPESL